MTAVVEKRERDDLFREIINAYRQWSELEREVFSLARYHGQSPESISRALLMDMEEVGEILKACDVRLHQSLKAFFRSGCEKSSASATGSGLAASDTPASRSFDLSAPPRIPA